MNLNLKPMIHHILSTVVVFHPTMYLIYSMITLHLEGLETSSKIEMRDDFLNFSVIKYRKYTNEDICLTAIRI